MASAPEVAAGIDDGKGLARRFAEVKDSKGRRVLHFAAAGGKTDVCKYLLEELKFDVDVRDEKGETPFLHAVLGGYLKTSKYLLDCGANPFATSESGFTPLHDAAEKGHKRLLRLLISKGVDVDPQHDSGSPLQWAAAHCKQDAVRILLEHHANPNVVFHHMFTPLVASVLSESLECTLLLIQAGANPNAISDGITPLEMATSNGSTEMMECLLKAGADPNVTNDYDMKPIEVAALRGSRRDVMVLFPLTSPVPTISDWSVDGIIEHVHSEAAREQSSHKLNKKFPEAKSRGEAAFKRKQYLMAIRAYTEAITADPSDASVLSNRSLCWVRLGQGALADAKECRFLRPDWPKACYREGAAWRLLKRLDKAAIAFYRGLKLDPENKDLQDAFREAFAALKHQRQHENGCSFW